MDAMPGALFKAHGPVRSPALPASRCDDSVPAMSVLATNPSLRIPCAVALALGVGVRAELIQLRDGAAITAKIVSEKKDHLYVDLGFSVLAVPRAEIVKVSKEAAPGQTPTKTPAIQESMSRLFAVATTPPPERPVRELAQALGESVVQVRTPGGLGSGFFVTEDGHLITNFHVIEGETQIGRAHV